MTETMMRQAGISDVLQPAAARARRLGLYLDHFNSGSRYNQNNGTRIFLGREPQPFFSGHHVAHLTTLREVNAFLDGYECNRKIDAA